MLIDFLELRNSETFARVLKLSTTSGLASAYQLTDHSTSSISAVTTTGGDMLIDLSTLPWQAATIFTEPYYEVPDILLVSNEDILSAGYKEMALENELLAEKILPVALESLPEWEG